MMPGMHNAARRRLEDSLVAAPSQLALDLQGNGGSATSQQVSLYNTSGHSVTVRGTYRQIGSEFQIGQTVTEAVSAPDPSLPVPQEGATAVPRPSSSPCRRTSASWTWT